MARKARKTALRTYNIGNVRVTVSEHSRRMLAAHGKQMRANLAGRKGPLIYSPIRDLIIPSKNLRRMAVGKKVYAITPSIPVQGVMREVEVHPRLTIKRADSGRIETIYWKKTLFDSKGRPVTVFVKDQRDRKSLRLEEREIEDGLKQRKRAGIKTPELVVRVERKKPLRRITATKEILDVVAADALVAFGISSAERRQIIADIRMAGEKLIAEGLFPTQTKADHVLVSRQKPRKYYFADAAAGFTPTNRNRLTLLEAIKADPSIPKPNWDRIHFSFAGMRQYWDSLPAEVRRKIQRRQLDRLIREIGKGPQFRPVLRDVIPQVEALILGLFPNSNAAQRIRRKGR